MLVLAAILITTVAGMSFALAIDRTLRGPQLLGLGYLYGAGIVYFVMLAVPRWSALWVTLAVLAVTLIFARRPRSTAQPLNRFTAIDLATLLVITSYIAFVTLSPLPEWDFWSIWGLKARVFIEHGGIDWRFLLSPSNSFAHPDYPLLVPLNDAYATLMNGGWDDARLGLVSVAFGVALLLVIRGVTRSAAITFACAPIALAIPAGTGEVALIAYASAGLLLLRDDNKHAPILLGLAGCAKNEGIALIAVAAIALLLTDRRRVLRLWPAALIVAPWLAIRAWLQIPTDLAEGSFVGRVAERLPHLGAILVELAAHLADRWLWLGIIAALLIATWDALYRQRVVIVAVALQLAVYVIVYLGAPRSVDWLIENSWSRLTRQMLVPALAAAMLALAQTFSRSEDAPHAEARSDL